MIVVDAHGSGATSCETSIGLCGDVEVWSLEGPWLSLSDVDSWGSAVTVMVDELVWWHVLAEVSCEDACCHCVWWLSCVCLDICRHCVGKPTVCYCVGAVSLGSVSSAGTVPARCSEVECSCVAIVEVTVEVCGELVWCVVELVCVVSGPAAVSP